MTATLAKGLSPVRTMLDSGAVVLAQETASPAVAIIVSFQAGSLYDPDGRPGLAYLTGLTMDRGTERRPLGVIAEELDARGVALRATTTRHATTLSCTCLPDDFDDVLAIVMDVARRPVFPEEEIAKRRAETLTALGQDADNPAVRAVESMFELLYGPDHPYGRRAKGTPASIERMARSSMAAFHTAHVRPAVLTLAIVGDVRPGDVMDRAAAELSGWTGGPATPTVVPPPAVPPSRRRHLIEMPGKSQSDIAYGFATISRLDPRYYAYWMMNNILGQFGLGGRLAENIRERQGMAYYAFSAFEPNLGEGALLARAGVNPRDVERAVDAIDFEVRQLGAEGPTAAEVEQTRDSLIGSIPRLFETNHSIAVFLQNCEHFGLGLDYDQRLPGLLQTVTIGEIAAAAAETLRPELAAIAIAGPPGPEA